MVQAWYMKSIGNDDDRRLENHFRPPQYVDLERLRRVTGVIYYQLNAKTYEEDGSLDKIRKERGYNYEDEIEISHEKLPNEMILRFFEEHLHTDEEIRFIVDGSGYFDVRDFDDKWIRVKCESGDLIILPAGIYHRFTLDEKNYAKAKRYFVGEPVWVAHNRPAEEFEARIQYLKWLKEEQQFSRNFQ